MANNRVKKCNLCGNKMHMSKGCGVLVCEECGNHDGLERCYCGWSLTNDGHGSQELEEMGECLDNDY